jgi:hypothetical protein
VSTGNTFNAMAARIAFELGRRSDLLADGSIATAINDAIQIYQKERFRFNENQPLAPFHLNTVPMQYIYTVADDPRIPQLYKIDYINYLLGSTNNKMSRDVPEAVYLATITGQASGPPGFWAWDGNSIAIYPAPNQVYQLTIGGYWAYPAPTDLAGDITNPWMNEAERLIRSRAKYEIALHVTRSQPMQAAMSPVVDGGGASDVYYKELKAEANKIRGTSRIRPMAF